MDRLDKLSPKDIKPLKDSPIAQGLISNTLFQILWNGIYFVIGLLIRHYALISGIPPFMAILLGVVGFFLMSLSVNLLRRKKEARALNTSTVATLDSRSPAQLQPAPAKPKLNFEIDDKDSNVSVKRGGSHLSHITAEIKLRCEREPDSLMVVRSFRLSLHRLDANGKVITIHYQKESQVIWEDSKGKLVPFSDGWTIDRPRSDYRYYSFNIEITPQAQAELSSDHFLELTMDAIGQDLVSKAVYVKDWSEGSFSPISLKPFAVFSPEAQKEIRQLKDKLNSYEKTNEQLGRHDDEKDEQIKRLNTALSNERLTGESLKRTFEERGKELFEIRNSFAIETAKAGEEIEQLRSEIAQLNGYVRHPEKYRGLRETADTHKGGVLSAVSKINKAESLIGTKEIEEAALDIIRDCKDSDNINATSQYRKEDALFNAFERAIANRVKKAKENLGDMEYHLLISAITGLRSELEEISRKFFGKNGLGDRLVIKHAKQPWPFEVLIVGNSMIIALRGGRQRATYEVAVRINDPKFVEKALEWYSEVGWGQADSDSLEPE